MQKHVSLSRSVPVDAYEKFFDRYERQHPLINEAEFELDASDPHSEPSEQRRCVYRNRAKTRAQMLRNWCSGHPTTPPNFWTPYLENGKAGIGIALFFNFIKDYMLAWLGMCIYAFYALVEYSYGDGPTLSAAEYEEINRNPPDLLKISISNLGDKRVSLGLMVTDMLFCLLFLIFVYHQKQREHSKIVSLQRNRVNASDYSFQLTGLPRLPYKTSELADFFSSFGSVSNVKIVVDCTKIVDIRREQKIAVRNYDHCVSQEKLHPQRPWYWSWISSEDVDHEDNKVLKVLQYIGFARDQHYWKRQVERLEQEYALALLQPAQPTGRAFITFDSIDAAIDCKEVYMKASIMRTCQLIFCYTGPPRFRYRNIFLSDVPEPQDILWENIGYSSFQQFLRKCRSICLALIFVVTATAMTTHWLDQDSTIETGDSFAIAFVVAFANFMVTRVLCLYVPRERHYSLTGTQTGLCIKLITFLLINSILIVFVSALIASSNGTDGNDPSFDLQEFWKTPEFVEVYSLTMITASAGPIIRRFVLQYTRILREWIYDSTAYTESDFEKVYANPPFDLAEAYAYAFHVMFLALIISPLAPIVLIVCFLAFVAHYFVCRYMILRVNGPPPPYEMKLALRLERFAPISVALHMAASCACFSLQGVDYEDSVIYAALHGEYAKNLFTDRFDAQDNFLFFYWILTALTIVFTVVVPLTPIRSIMQNIPCFRREQFIVSEKLALANPLSFNQAVTSRYFVPYQPPMLQEDHPQERATKMDDYIDQLDKRLLGEVLWDPAYMIDSDTASPSSPHVTRSAAQRS
eukprot:TRINITY_DN10315_c0_g1_i1.p1 TRINITY_DN10315_c0_g1~~TRINITY_DN10315_c0_g1_i1.p1  ORF type:complete len:806 (+),score=165.53 TRINITY_DN10315_c0_g1_i1:43-2460(+)